MACLPTTTPHTHTAGQRFFCTRSCRPPLSLPSPRVALTVELHEVDGGPAQPRPRLIHSLMNGGGREGGWHSHVPRACPVCWPATDPQPDGGQLGRKNEGRQSRSTPDPPQVYIRDAAASSP